MRARDPLRFTLGDARPLARDEGQHRNRDRRQLPDQHLQRCQGLAPIPASTRACIGATATAHKYRHQPDHGAGCRASYVLPIYGPRNYVRPRFQPPRYRPAQHEFRTPERSGRSQWHNER